MSSNERVDVGPVASEEGAVPIPSPEKLPSHVQDWLLSQLVSLVNDFQLEFGVTLNVHGTIVSGTMIGGKQYLEEMAGLMGASSTSEQGDGTTFEQVMAEFFRSWIPLLDKRKGTDDEIPAPAPRYIHLRDARTLMGGGTIVPSKGGVLWRGRVAAIDGFSLGSLSFD